jgi:hypothetical protein
MLLAFEHSSCKDKTQDDRYVGCTEFSQPASQQGRTVKAITLSSFFLFQALCFTAQAAEPATSASVEKRLQALEHAAEENQGLESDRGVRSFLNTKLNIGGFSETGITGIFERAHGPQAAVSSTTLGINLGAEFSENFRFTSQFLSQIAIPVSNPHDDPRASSFGVTGRREFGAYTLTTLVTQAFVEWEKSDAFHVEGGIGYAPYALSFQQLELVLFVRRGGPQLLRSNNELVHLLWQGLHVRGSFLSPMFRWGYNVYTFSPSTNTQMLGVGTRLWLSSPRNAVNFGFSTQTAARGSSTYTTAGPDLRLRLGRLTVTSELAKSYGQGAQPWSAHLEPDFDVYQQSVLLYVFGDYLESKMNRTGGLPLTSAGVADPFKKWEYGAGSYAANSGGGRNYWQLDLSAGVAF